jgi:hypothetical protein
MGGEKIRCLQINSWAGSGVSPSLRRVGATWVVAMEKVRFAAVVYEGVNAATEWELGVSVTLLQEFDFSPL